MLSASDLLRLPYDDTLSEAGVMYARKSLHYTYNRMSLHPVPRLRKIVAGIAVELAFRRWLEREEVRYDLLGATHFTSPDHYDISLGGRLCDVKSFILSRKDHIRAARADPGYLLDASALVPLEQLNSEKLGPNDIFIFGFLAGQETQHRDELQKVLAKGLRKYLMYTFTAPEWSRPERWDGLGRLALKSNATRAFTVEVGGQNRKREPHFERLTLSPRARQQTRLDYYSLLYLHVADVPDGALGVHSPGLKQTHIVQPDDWGNIWIYGLEVFIAGWLSKRDFLNRSRLLPAGTKTLLYTITRTHNREVPVKKLRPMSELVQMLRDAGWA